MGSSSGRWEGMNQGSYLWSSGKKEREENEPSRLAVVGHDDG